MMIFTIVPFLALYLLIRVVWPNCRRNGRLLFFLLLLAGGLFPLVVEFFGGGIISPTLGLYPMLVGEFFLLALLQCAIFFLLRDAAIVLLFIFGKRKTFLSSKRTVCILFLSAVLVSAFAQFNAFKDPIVHTVSVEIDNLPAPLDGLRIAQLSDLHQANVFGPDRLERIVKKTNDLHADLIVVTGDFVDATVQRRARELAALRKLQAPLGVFACEGNHEHYADYDGWMRQLPLFGMRLLRNEHSVLQYHGTPFVIVGLTDRGAGRFNREEPDPEKALKGAPDAFTLALAHQPRLASELSNSGVDLMLSGHTHGGQTYLWSIAVAIFNEGFVRGLYTVVSDSGHRMALYVHSGTGLWTGFMQRIGTSNEIALITLKSKGK